MGFKRVQGGAQAQIYMDVGEKKCKSVKIRNDGSMQDQTIRRAGSQQRGERLFFTKLACTIAFANLKPAGDRLSPEFNSRVGPNSSRLCSDVLWWRFEEPELVKVRYDARSNHRDLAAEPRI